MGYGVGIDHMSNESWDDITKQQFFEGTLRTPPWVADPMDLLGLTAPLVDEHHGWCEPSPPSPRWALGFCPPLWSFSSVLLFVVPTENVKSLTYNLFESLYSLTTGCWFVLGHDNCILVHVIYKPNSTQPDLFILTDHIEMNLLLIVAINNYGIKYEAW
jgi:hypothetical protein